MANIVASCNEQDGLDEAAQLVELVAGFKPEKRRLMSLAGPNDVIQFLFDNAGWMTLAGVGMICSGALGRMGEQLYEALWARLKSYDPNFETRASDADEMLRADKQIASLASFVATMIGSGKTITFGIQDRMRGRNIGIEIDDSSMKLISKSIGVLALINEDLEQELAKRRAEPGVDLDTTVQNQDMSGKIQLEEDGRSSITFRISRIGANQEIVVVRYGPDGHRLK